MGTGEPFDNYDEVIRFTQIVTHPYGMALAPKHITISTAGIVPKIRQFALESLPINLAISLHAPTNDLRTKIMKINQAFPLEKLMDAVDFYLAKTRRRITFEYILIDELNDELHHADQLADLLENRDCYVNLIPYNAVMENDYRRPSPERISAFFNHLMQRGILCTVRKELGHDIASACGQLRAQYQHETQR
jgi:23S rRNA (adenine2503-C2)-methyltransferase